jgi:hypothetical protein
LARDTAAGLVQPLANIFDCLTKRTAIDSDHSATFAAGEFAMVGNPHNRLVVLMPTLRTADFYVGVVNWIRGHRLIS